MKIEVSNGEIIDKLTIIQIKLERIKTRVSLKIFKRNTTNFLKLHLRYSVLPITLYKLLYNVNCELWDIEDRIRDLERKKDFGDDFISTATCGIY